MLSWVALIYLFYFHFWTRELILSDFNIDGVSVKMQHMLELLANFSLVDHQSMKETFLASLFMDTFMSLSVICDQADAHNVFEVNMLKCS